MLLRFFVSLVVDEQFCLQSEFSCIRFYQLFKPFVGTEDFVAAIDNGWVHDKVAESLVPLLKDVQLWLIVVLDGRINPFVFKLDYE